MNGPVFESQFDKPNGLAVSPDGSVYVAEGDQRSIRRIFSVDDGAQAPPYFNSLPGAQVFQEQTYSHTYTALDPNDDDLLYEVIELPVWLSFDGVDTISGAPTSNNLGEFQIRMSVSDGYHSHSIEQTSKVRVSPIDPPGPENGGGGSFGLSLLLGFLLRTIMQGRKNGQ